MKDGGLLKARGKALYARLEAWPRWQRVTLGVLLIIGGILGFLPILGFWMLPLGLAVLAIDVPLAAKATRRLERAVKKVIRRWRKS
jgi:hypothetical protein